MRLLDRHVLTETAVAGGAATGAFVFVMVAGNILTQVSSAIASGRVSGWEGLELVGLLFPGVLPYALPLGLLTGVLIDPKVARETVGRLVSVYIEKTRPLSEIVRAVTKLIGPAQ